MNLKSKKRLAADVLGVGVDRIILDDEAHDLIQDAITRSTIRGLVGLRAIKVAPGEGVSRGRKRTRDRRRMREVTGRSRGDILQVGQEAGVGQRVRALRWRLKVSKERGDVTKEAYKTLYKQVKGGQIRDVKQLQALMKEVRR